jgi:hypothetical protein
MKQKILLLFILFKFFDGQVSNSMAQALNKMVYQAVVRNASNQVFEYYIIRVRTSILQGSAIGPSVYTETQLVNTDAKGLLKVEIGTGTVVSGNFETINWANGPYFIKTEMDPNAGVNYSMSSTTQLLSVPYTFLAKKSASSVGNGTFDQAYDYTNFKGEGRTIIADSGAVKIDGEDGIMVTGIFGYGNSVEVEGSGTRLFFNPRKASFRAGIAPGTEFDSTNVGLYSTALGLGTKAIGETSFASGVYSVASGLASTALGSGSNEASGSFSHAMGYHAKASGSNATACGEETKAVGIASSAFGSYSKAQGDYSASFGHGWTLGHSSSVFGKGTRNNGMYATTVGLLNDTIVDVQTSSTSYNPLFIVGAGGYTYDYWGSATAYTDNALVVYKNGHVQFGWDESSAYANKKMHTFQTSIGSYFANNIGPSNDISLTVQGKMGIGLSNPSSLLHVKGSTDASLSSHGLSIIGDIAEPNLVMDNNEILARNNGATSRLGFQEGGGTVSIGLGSSSHVLQINGVGRSTSANWATSSDRRAKKNIESLSNASLDNILKLRPVTYEWINEYKAANAGLKEKNTGFISQEVEQIFPEMIETVNEKFGDKSIEDFKILNLSDLPVQLTKAIQLQQGLIKDLKNKIAHRQEQIDQISKSIK